MRFTLSIIFTLTFTTLSYAELPSPRLDRITPLGASAGSTVEVDVSGSDIEEAKVLIFDHSGIKAEWVKDKKFKVTIAADTPEGTYDCRVVGKFGISSPRLFAVSRGLTEVAEKEPNDEPATAQLVTINSVINGSSDQGKDDIFRFPAKKGQKIVVECFGQRLDSPIDASLTLTNASGKQLASNGDYHGRDPLVEFVAPDDGDYLVTINDLSYAGGLPYRLVIADRVHIENVFPRAVQVGKTSNVNVYGRNIGGKSPLILNDLPLETRLDSTNPADAILKRGQFTFTHHPTGHSVLPTAATCTLTGFQHLGVPMLLSDTPVTLEQEPNDTVDKAQMLTLPAVVSGRFDKERDADWFAIEPSETGSYSFEVYCERIGGQADPYLVIFDEKDARVQELDDFGIRTNAFDGHLRDPSGSVNLTAKKKYKVLVQDRYRRGGPRYQYVLTVRKAIPDFYPAVIHQQNPGPGGLSIRKGGTAHVDVIVHNKEGFNGPITITAENLPKGLHCLPTVINNDTKGNMVFWADTGAADWHGPIRLIATGKRGDETLTREVRPHSRVWNIQDANSSRPTRELMAAICETAPFQVSAVSQRIEVEAGKKMDVKLVCKRNWPEFKAAVNLTPALFPNAIKAGAVSMGEGKNEATLTLDIPANARAGEYTVTVQCQAQVPFVKDAKETKGKGVTLVTMPSVPFTVVVNSQKK